MDDAKPKIPAYIDPLGTAILLKLHRNPAMSGVILGGGFALQHYHEFRPSHDIDAWWSDAPTEGAKSAISEAVQEVAREHAFEFRKRFWNETFSYEIVNPDTKKNVFSFQIATRDVALDPPLPSAWEPLLIETLRDNVGSKMNALADRGAPRDFIDIHELVQAGVCTIRECWELWQMKNPGADLGEAKDKVMQKISELEARTPLDRVPEERRAAAAQRRAFFKERFTSESRESNEDELGW
jgi:hypothetical protein